MKYRPDFPERFGCIEDARAHCRAFFTWYNTTHRHSGIGCMTPHSVHDGRADALRLTRQATLDEAFRAHPERFKNKNPRAGALPTAAWINPPQHETTLRDDPLPQGRVGGRGGPALRGASGAKPQPSSVTSPPTAAWMKEQAIPENPQLRTLNS